MADLPDISHFGHAELLALRTAVDQRLDRIRADFIEKAAALGLAVVDGNCKKARKRRSSASKESE